MYAPTLAYNFQAFIAFSLLIGFKFPMLAGSRPLKVSSPNWVRIVWDLPQCVTFWHVTIHLMLGVSTLCGGLWEQTCERHCIELQRELKGRAKLHEICVSMCVSARWSINARVSCTMHETWDVCGKYWKQRRPENKAIVAFARYMCIIYCVPWTIQDAE